MLIDVVYMVYTKFHYKFNNTILYKFYSKYKIYSIDILPIKIFNDYLFHRFVRLFQSWD